MYVVVDVDADHHRFGLVYLGAVGIYEVVPSADMRYIAN